jgi:hypothetical protein
MTHPHPRALEAAARALRLLLQDGDANASELARAAVTTYLAALQKTHALVPRDPTETMMLASRAVKPSQHWRDNIRRAWSAMIDAAPPPAAQEPRP